MIKPITPVMKKHFERLEQDEARLRDTLQEAYDLSAVPRIAGIIFAFLTDPAPITARIPVSKAKTLASAGVSRGGQVMSFDELHRLTRADALLLELEAVQAEHADMAYAMIQEHITSEAASLWQALAEWEGLLPLYIDPVKLELILIDEQYPIEPTLDDACIKAGRRAGQMVLQLQAQGQEAAEVVKTVETYMRKTTRQATDIVTYYEDTRSADDIALLFLDAAGEKYFRTRCIHDGKTCEVCLRMEAEQERYPVALSEQITGVNTPPFHPYCRCWVEVVEHD